MGDRQTRDTARPWTCPACGATIAMLVFARGKPPELLPRMPVIAIRGGVVWFRCLHCHAPVDWKIKSAT